MFERVGNHSTLQRTNVANAAVDPAANTGKGRYASSPNIFKNRPISSGEEELRQYFLDMENVKNHSRGRLQQGRSHELHEYHE